MNNDKNEGKDRLSAGDEGKGLKRIRAVRFVYGVLAAGYLICVILQVFFAGMGVFVDSSDLELHRTFANYFEFAAIILFLLSFAGRCFALILDFAAINETFLIVDAFADDKCNFIKGFN